ncbi:MAG: 50S ribosomal protein L19 [Candidatus Shikimatogenerans sp. Ttur]|uniref:Large ribosomal subunit protein bL19 n=1 Tax=Candidatus Shikimatogenerans sp. Ttur TaxID=3158569 RepID=A0AAU7ZY23_9FLAO
MLNNTFKVGNIITIYYFCIEKKKKKKFFFKGIIIKVNKKNFLIRNIYNSIGIEIIFFFKQKNIINININQINIKKFKKSKIYFIKKHKKFKNKIF